MVRSLGCEPVRIAKMVSFVVTLKVIDAVENAVRIEEREPAGSTKRAVAMSPRRRVNACGLISAGWGRVHSACDRQAACADRRVR